MKQKHLFDTFQKNPDKMPFECLVGNLCGSILTEIEKAGMSPPINNHSFYMDGDNADEKSIIYRTWEPEE